jgi:putative oxidoreductase
LRWTWHLDVAGEAGRVEALPARSPIGQPDEFVVLHSHAMNAQDLARLLLRIAIGGLMLFHGVSKLQHGIPAIVGSVTAHGLPAAFAYGVYLGEVAAPILVLAGIATRLAASVIAVNMIVAVSLSHRADLFHLGRGGGYALELQALYFLGAIAIALFGSGRYAVSRGRGTWR